MSAKHRIIDAAFLAISASGVHRLLEPLARGSGMILMFHHVRPWQERQFAPNRSLEVTPEFLELTIREIRALGFDIIGMDEVKHRLETPSAHARPFAAITFDDGYRDNITYAAPVLARLGAPWTLYVVPHFAEGRGRLWWIELEEALLRLERVEITIGADAIALDTRTTTQKQTAFNVLHDRLKAGPEDVMLGAVDELCRAARIDMSGLVSDLCADWTEIEALAESPDVTIGAHTMSHPILARHEAKRVEEEISLSGKFIERRLSRPVKHFAYPHGDRLSVGTREFAASTRAGYQTAVTTFPGHVSPRDLAAMTALPRVSINGLHQKRQAVRAMASGVPFLPANLLRKKAFR
jgi:peptidoglycan/xylan/chitin deacetylase (PgdA/CDA1 family)